MKQVNLGTKIIGGFGVLLVIAGLLGGIAIVQMKGVEADSLMLAREYAPETRLASDLERRVYSAMFAIRGYGYTGDQKFHEEGVASMDRVKTTLGELETLGAQARHLVRLKDLLAEAKGAMAAYEQLVADTAREIDAQAQVDVEMAGLDTTYMDAAAALLKSQTEAMTKEITEGAGADHLTARLTTITMVQHLIDLGNAARIANLQARVLRDTRVINEGFKSVFPAIEDIGRQLRVMIRVPADRQGLAGILTAGKAYRAAMEKYLATSLALDKINGERTVSSDKALEVARTMMTAASAQTDQIANQAVSTLRGGVTALLVGLLVALGLGIAAAVFITRSITLPINRVIAGLNEGAEQVSSAAGQVSSASQSLAEGSSEQAASIEETSSSLEEMSSKTRRNADNASQADNLMKAAGQVVANANQSMTQLTGSMAAISKASEETSKIIKTIDEIAFQTNLLALNAAVEAARAGEAGAGFAVVADEVRNLAMRAAEAAKNTAALIEGTVKKVKEGAELVAGTSRAFTEVAASTTKVGGIVAQIAAASGEQSQGIGQITTAVTEMDKITQQNAATAEESASASEELNAQAEQMKAFVDELVAMVGGRREGNGEHHESSTPGRGQHAARPAPKGSALKDEGLAHTVPADRETRPEQFIPLEGEEHLMEL
jgi:methyl-accepting chemotaxis protein